MTTLRNRIAKKMIALNPCKDLLMMADDAKGELIPSWDNITPEWVNKNRLYLENMASFGLLERVKIPPSRRATLRKKGIFLTHRYRSTPATFWRILSA